MRFDHFEFGGLDAIDVRRELDGLATVLTVPRCSTPELVARVERDLSKVERALRQGRSPSPVICFVASAGSDDAYVPAHDDVPALALSRSFLDLDVPVLRMAELRDDGCPLAYLALFHHVVFARRGGSIPNGDRLFPDPRAIAVRRGPAPEPDADGGLAVDDLLSSGVVDLSFEGDAATIMIEYARRNDRRRNGELGIHAAIRHRALAEERRTASRDAAPLNDGPVELLAET